jgi:3',5'-cyclic AMP phosphodiesterase CpdA
MNTNGHELLYFWVIGDMHFRAREQWQAIHTPRMNTMFEDLHTLWQEKRPAFCVSPGDIVDKGNAASYELAKRVLSEQLMSVPFYPGIGNHEFQAELQADTGKEDTLHTGKEFIAVWNRPVRYAWMAGMHNEIVCIMLDQPNPFLPGSRVEDPHVIFSQDTLSFLDTTLTEHAGQRAILFAHSPLHNTVLDRDPARNFDADSLDPFFYVENSGAVRTILARHPNATLYISGHTHSGWGSPQLVFPEIVGGHSITHINVMSPWYTGRRAGVRMNPERTHLIYKPAVPDIQATFAFHIYADRAVVRAREHITRQWIGEWEIMFTHKI